MKNIALRLMDATLVLAVLSFFYIRVVYGHGRTPISIQIAHLRDICFALTLVAMFAIPIRIKSYPAIYNFIEFNTKGEKRKTIIVPLIAMIAIILGTVVIIRIFVVAAP
ncbi:hypothetical protein [Burkholderia diffusa]|uniref:hypothetical protein n=1 Tax=Burkholderia diffusa TaxID=488732 RepID=UPI0015817CC2|nr:hypothetical protein [Burkholderia diffusa]